MSDAPNTAPNAAQLQGTNEYLSVMIDTLQGQLNEAHSKLTTAQTNATVLQRANQRLGAQVADLQGKLAAAQTVLTPEVIDNNPALDALKDAAPAETSTMPKLTFAPGARAAGAAAVETDASAGNIPAPDAADCTAVTH